MRAWFGPKIRLYKTFVFQPWCRGYREKYFFKAANNVWDSLLTHTLTNNRTKDGWCEQKENMGHFISTRGRTSLWFFFLVGFKKKTNLDMSEAWVVDLSTPLRVTPFFLCYIQSQTCYHRWANVFWWTPIKSPHTEWHRAKLTDYQKRPKLRDFF